MMHLTANLSQGRNGKARLQEDYSLRLKPATTINVFTLQQH